jgi:antitoxin component YwqK of YwqJK toxin-antitoxin module
MKYEGNYKDGKKDGKWTRWCCDGTLRIEENYKDGELIPITQYRSVPKRLSPKSAKLHNITITPIIFIFFLLKKFSNPCLS